EGMGYTMVKGNGEPFKATKLKLSVPLTLELAADIPGAKRTVFKLNDGTPNDDLESATFRHSSKALTIEIRADQNIRPSAKLVDAKAKRFRVPRRAHGVPPVLKFEVIVLEIGANDLLTLKEALFEQRYFSFGRMQGGFLNEAEAAERRESKDAAPVKSRGRARDDDEVEEPAGESAPLH